MEDEEAFVFNMEKYWIPKTKDRALYADKQGFSFGDYILTVSGKVLNSQNAGWCKTEFQNDFDIKGIASPLTNQEKHFTCAQLEVFKLV